MKRKITDLDMEESRLSKLLFNKSNEFASKLKNEENNDLDIEQKPAWFDEDDDKIIFVAPNTKSKKPHSEKLKEKYEALIGTPSWAKLNKITKTEEDNDDKLLRTVGHLRKKKSINLKKDFIELKIFPKINSETHNEGAIISCVEFHPKMSVSLVSGSSGAVSLFSIGGDVNNKLHSFKLKKWKVSAAQFTPDGTEVFITSKYNDHMCIYNLVKAESKLTRLPNAIKKPQIFIMSPNGKYLAISGGFDEVYIMCTKSKELLRSLKNNNKIQSMAFSHDSGSLYCYSVDGQVTVWDLTTSKALKKFYDHGCVTASCITTSQCGRLLATGSGEGILNVYETTKLTASEPLPLKTISNLTTIITDIKFNSTSEILAASSKQYPNAVKLVHIPSYHVFANFPDQQINLHHVERVNFSPNSGYMALGNNKGSALLYRLKHYKNY